MSQREPNMKQEYNPSEEESARTPESQAFVPTFISGPSPFPGFSCLEHQETEALQLDMEEFLDSHYIQFRRRQSQLRPGGHEMINLSMLNEPTPRRIDIVNYLCQHEHEWSLLVSKAHLWDDDWRDPRRMEEFIDSRVVHLCRRNNATVAEQSTVSPAFINAFLCTPPGVLSHLDDVTTYIHFHLHEYELVIRKPEEPFLGGHHGMIRRENLEKSTLQNHYTVQTVLNKFRATAMQHFQTTRTGSFHCRCVTSVTIDEGSNASHPDPIALTSATDLEPYLAMKSFLATTRVMLGGTTRALRTRNHEEFRQENERVRSEMMVALYDAMPEAENPYSFS